MYSIFLQPIILEAKQRGIKVEALCEGYKNFARLSHNGHEELIHNTITSRLTHIQTLALNDKYIGNMVLKNIGVNVPTTYLLNREMIESKNFDFQDKMWAIKPLKEYGGKGVSINIRTHTDIKKAFNKALKEQLDKTKNKVIAQEMIQGDEYRVLVINHKKVFLVKREPANVIGDGISSLIELIEEKNNEAINKTRIIKVDQELESFLKKHGRTYSDVPKKGEKVKLSHLANSHKGGTSIEMSQNIPSHIYNFAIDLSKKTNLKVVGIDIITPDIEETYGNVIELNLNPGLTIHKNPTVGQPSFPEKAIIDMLFPETANI
mgnify:CR=1 FL=1